VGEWEQDILKGVYYALVLTLEILRKFHFVIQNKAAVNVPGYAIYIPSMPYGHWCIHAPMATFGIVGCYTYRCGASALFVSMTRAILRSLKSGASDSAGLHTFFMSLS